MTDKLKILVDNVNKAVANRNHAKSKYNQMHVSLTCGSRLISEDEMKKMYKEFLKRQEFYEKTLYILFKHLALDTEVLSDAFDVPF